MKIVYSGGYDLNLGKHVFPSVKYRRTRESLIERSIVSRSDFVEPGAALDEQICLVHSRDYVRRLKNGALSDDEIRRLEVPCSPQFVRAVWLGVGGTIEACRRALLDGIGVTLSGGFHHAFPDHGEGFCALNDVAVSIRALQAERTIRSAMVIDCDVHHGNGTAAIFRDDPSVFTLSIHQLNNYPVIKPPSDIDIDLADGTGDEEYMDKLARGLECAFCDFHADLIIYLAGADPYQGDQLGGLALTIEGIKRRDIMVFREARTRKIPVAVTLAGGYAYDVGDTVEIHVNTVRAAQEAFGSRDVSPEQDY